MPSPPPPSENFGRKPAFCWAHPANGKTMCRTTGKVSPPAASCPRRTPCNSCSAPLPRPVARAASTLGSFLSMPMKWPRTPMISPPPARNFRTCNGSHSPRRGSSICPSSPKWSLPKSRPAQRKQARPHRFPSSAMTTKKAFSCASPDKALWGRCRCLEKKSDRSLFKRRVSNQNEHKNTHRQKAHPPKLAASDPLAEYQHRGEDRKNHLDLPHGKDQGRRLQGEGGEPAQAAPHACHPHPDRHAPGLPNSAQLPRFAPYQPQAKAECLHRADHGQGHPGPKQRIGAFDLQGRAAITHRRDGKERPRQKPQSSALVGHPPQVQPRQPRVV